MWSILSGRGLTQPSSPGYASWFYHDDSTAELIPGRVYTGFASDGHGGSSGVTFGFDKNGRMIFPDSFDE